MGLLLASCVSGRLVAQGGVAAELPVDARSLLQEGRLHEAIEMLKGHLQTAPHDTVAQRAIAHASFQLGDYNTAAAYSVTVLSDHPNDTWARMVFSLSTIFLQDAVDADDARAQLALGRQCVAGGAYVAAVHFYRRYLTIMPGDTPVRKEYARMLSWGNRPALSIKEYRRCLENDPEDDAVRLEMARLMNRTGNHHQAAQQFRILLNRQPGLPGLRVDLARALAWDGDSEGCVGLLRELAKAPAVVEPESLPFLAESAARLACPVEERVFLSEAAKAGAATPTMQARLEAISLRSSQGAGTPSDVEDADFDDFWRLVMDQRKALHQERERLGDAWTKQNPVDLASVWETGKTHELLERNDAALACYLQVDAVSSTPLVRARVHRLQSLVAEGTLGAAPRYSESKP